MKTFDIKKVLVPTDLSETAYLALEHAALMAALYKAELYLLHVIEIPPEEFGHVVRKAGANLATGPLGGPLVRIADRRQWGRHDSDNGVSRGRARPAA